MLNTELKKKKKKKKKRKEKKRKEKKKKRRKKRKDLHIDAPSDAIPYPVLFCIYYAIGIECNCQQAQYFHFPQSECRLRNRAMVSLYSQSITFL